jgi:arylformamidase
MRPYLQYDQSQLDAQYNMRARHPDFQAHFDLWERESGRVAARLRCEPDRAYGDSEGQALDVFPARAPGAPVQVFIHGGYWQSLDKGSFRFLAEPLVQAGAAVVLINYDLAPKVGMDEIVRQVRRAIVWSYRNAASFNGDPQRLYVSGHSAGGHLTAMAVATDWRELAGRPGDLPTDLIKGGCSLSGLFDLEPVRRCYLNAVLGLDAETARRNSPLHLLHGHAAPLIAAVGLEESDEFLRNNRALAAAWRARGRSCQELALPGLNHFTMVEELGQPDSPLTRALLEQMGL